MWNQVITLFREYMGTGLIVGWFLIALIYLLLKEKRKHIRILFVYVPIILLLLFFNPLFAKVLYAFVGNEIYYRILWLIPMTVVIAYAVIHFYGTLRGRFRITFACVCSVLLVISGSYIYSNLYFSKADNLYHIPGEVVDICDAIEVEGREVMAVFPAEMLQYVRQYSPVVCMPYGREQTVYRWYVYDELYQVMEAEVIDVPRLAELAKERLCHYIILPQDREMKGNLLEYDYILFDTIDGYDIYQDMTIYIGL